MPVKETQTLVLGLLCSFPGIISALISSYTEPMSHTFVRNALSVLALYNLLNLFPSFLFHLRIMLCHGEGDGIIQRMNFVRDGELGGMSCESCRDEGVHFRVGRKENEMLATPAEAGDEDGR